MNMLVCTLDPKGSGLVQAKATAPRQNLALHMFTTLAREVRCALHPTDAKTFSCNCGSMEDDSMEFSIEINPYICNLADTLALFHSFVEPFGITGIDASGLYH